MEIEEKKVVVTDKLYKRESDRQTEIQRRNEEKDSSKSVQENVKVFNDAFAKEKELVELDMKSCTGKNKNQITEMLDMNSRRVQNMQKYLSESTIFLPKYEVRQAQEIISNLLQQIQDMREEFIPKKKFAFKSKKKQTEISETKELSNGSTSNSKAMTKEDDLQIELADCKFVDVQKQTLSKTDNEIFQKDVCLARLDDCEIKLFGAPSTVHMKNLNNCKVFCGPVSSSIFISDCKNCTFVIACQQLRTHTTTDSNFYLHVTSRAIIEDCSKVFFAPYNLHYESLNKHFEESGLDKAKNNWNDVDDFNWLATDVQSPNWSVMAEENRVKEFSFK